VIRFRRRRRGSRGRAVWEEERRKGGSGDGGGRRRKRSGGGEDAALGESEVAGRLGGVNDKLAPYVRQDIGVGFSGWRTKS
jgi:hypothetical protein